MKFLKNLGYVTLVFVTSFVILIIDLYLVVGKVINNNRFITYQITFLIYFIAVILFIRVFKKLKPYTLMILLILPQIFWAVFGLSVNWRLFPYIVPAKMIIDLFGQILGYRALNIQKPAILKQAAIYVCGAVIVFCCCWLMFRKDFTDKSLIETYKFEKRGTQPRKDILQIESELVDTMGNHLVFNHHDYYILDFSFHDCFPCRIKLGYLKTFSGDFPSNLHVIYISPSTVEKYQYFKFTLSHDKNDKISYAYLDDSELLKKMGIIAYPYEILLGPGSNVLRTISGFQESDAGFYNKSTLDLVKNEK